LFLASVALVVAAKTHAEDHRLGLAAEGTHRLAGVDLPASDRVIARYLLGPLCLVVTGVLLHNFGLLLPQDLLVFIELLLSEDPLFLAVPLHHLNVVDRPNYNDSYSWISFSILS
jgi:hypothetical protein